MSGQMLGDRFKGCRLEVGYGLREFGRKIDQTAGFVAQVESGDAYPSPQTLWSWCRSLGVYRFEAVELMARLMAERHDLGHRWRVWRQPAIEVIESMEDDEPEGVCRESEQECDECGKELPHPLRQPENDPVHVCFCGAVYGRRHNPLRWELKPDEVGHRPEGAP